MRACIGRRWFEMAYGRRAEPADGCRLAAINRALVASGGNLREAVMGIVAAEEFGRRPAAGLATTLPFMAAAIPPGHVAMSLRRDILDIVRSEVQALRVRFADLADLARLGEHLDALSDLQRLLGP